MVGGEGGVSALGLGPGWLCWVPWTFYGNVSIKGKVRTKQWQNF